jgi:hypothetical protein
VNGILAFPEFHLVGDPGMGGHQAHARVQPVPVLEIWPANYLYYHLPYYDLKTIHFFINKGVAYESQNTFRQSPLT